MRLLPVTMVICVAAAATGSPRADECIQPRNARVFASASGDHVFRVGRKGADLPEGALVAIQDNFRERSIWRARLVNVPARIFVPDDGRTVVAVDNAGCRFGLEHSVVVYGMGGRVLADYRLEDILSEREIRQHIQQTMAGRLWTEKARFDFDPSGKAFVITLAWGREVTIHLPTGAILGSR
jgi:hypothetical protein